MTYEPERIALATGITLNTQHSGVGAPIVFLHGFPESHRTWRHQIADLARDFRVIAPDQRGFGDSDKPVEVAAYQTERIVEDLIALADALAIGRFTLVGHDWGGAVAWLAALRHPDRIARLAIVNAPHPLIFQKSVIDDPAQRAASQYIRAFRDPAMAGRIEAMGLATFFDKSFAPHVAPGAVSNDERDRYLADWSQPGAVAAMLNWYRASAIVVPAADEAAEMPGWVSAPFPKVVMPTLVVWGMKDRALLPVQLDGLHDLVTDLRIVRLEDAGHFAPWERPQAVTAALRAFLAETA